MMEKIPEKVKNIAKLLKESGFEAYLVGGCVRDLLMNKKPKDWDIATNGKPEDILAIFPESFYENKFLTVGIKTNDETIGIVEITTYRSESGYSDRRHPDEVKPVETLEEDLSRRDFTMNAAAINLQLNSISIIDPFNGKKDIENKLIRAVGSPNERFSEDALRMMRAVRFFSQLNFSFDKETEDAIKKNANLLKHVANERIKDELVKIILSTHPAEGIEKMHKLDLLKHVLPELEKGVGIEQNHHHTYTIYKHSLQSLKHCPSSKLEVRLAALLHDIAKPQTKRGEGGSATFYNHDHLGSKITEKALKRLKFSNSIIEKVKLLVDNHMFYYNPDEVTESSVRRLIKKVGLENMKDLIDLRIADRLGSGVPKAKPYKLRHLEYVIDKVSRDAISVKMLKINGNDLINNLNINPGPKIGAILEVLLSEVIEDARKNNYKYLKNRAEQLKNDDIESLRMKAKEKIEEKKEEDDKEIKHKYWVK